MQQGIATDVNSVETVRVAMRGLERAGLEPALELRRVGGAVVDGTVQAGLSRPAYCQLWSRITRAAQREDFGLVLAREVEPGILGPLEWLATTARTLGDGLDALASCGQLLHTGGHYALERRRHEAAFVYYPGPSGAISRTLLDWSLAYFVRAARRVSSGEARASVVRLQYRRPAAVAQVEAVYGAPVQFDAPYNEVVFPRDQLDIPLITHDPEVHAALGVICRGRCAARVANDHVQRVRTELLAHLWREQLPTLDTVARTLGMSPRSLQRSLSSENVSFRQLLLAARMETAQRWLSDPRRSIGDIAHALGYSEASAFHRGYRAFFGRACRDDAVAD